MDIAACELLIQNNEAHSLYIQTSYNYWIQYSLFTWKWWVLLFMFTVPWYFWWRMVDKKRFLEIWAYGLMTFIAVIGSDATGVAWELWRYPIRLASKFPHILPIDTTVFPITYMLVYQYFSSWKSFIIASTVMAAVLAFVFEPIGVWVDVYELISWKYYYSFPLYIIFALALKAIIGIVKSVQVRP